MNSVVPETCTCKLRSCRVLLPFSPTCNNVVISRKRQKKSERATLLQLLNSLLNSVHGTLSRIFISPCCDHGYIQMKSIFCFGKKFLIVNFFFFLFQMTSFDGSYILVYVCYICYINCIMNKLRKNEVLLIQQ